MIEPDQNSFEERNSTYVSQRFYFPDQGGDWERIDIDPPLEYYGPTKTTHVLKVTTSTVTPGYRRRRRRGPLPDHPFHIKKYFKSDPKGPHWYFEFQNASMGNRVHQRTTFTGTCEAHGADISQGPPADDPYPRLAMKLLDQLQSEKANTAVAMAELNKTAALLTKTATKLVRAIRALKGLNVGEFARELGLTERAKTKIVKTWVRMNKGKQFSLKSEGRRRQYELNSKFVSQTWLEYSYGWKPLLKDVYDHAEALAATVVEREYVMREAKAKHYTEKRVVTDLPIWDQPWWSRRRQSSDQQWQAMEVRYSISPGAVQAVRAFGLTNPLEVAWELVPFSFVADWFIPLGDAIKALTATQGLTFHSGWKTTRSLHKLQTAIYGNQTSHPSGSLRLVCFGRAEASLWWFDIDRSLVLDFPTVPFPKWQDPRGLGHRSSATDGSDDSFANEKAAFKDSAHGLSAIALLQTAASSKGSSRRTLRV